MAQVINTNSISLLAQNNLNKSQSSLSTAIERLSSGLRINSAKDDAAGQAISNRFTANINGLTQASRNANDGISLAQTTEGALDEINDNLQAIRTLTVQSQNGTNSSSDLQSIQDEVTQRLSEVDRISQQTDFNGVKVLSDTKSLTIQVGSNDNETISIDLKKIDKTTLGLGTFNVNGPVGTQTAVTVPDTATVANKNDATATALTATQTVVSDKNGHTFVKDTTDTDNTKYYAADVTKDATTGDVTAVSFDSSKSLTEATSDPLKALDSALSTVDTMRSNLGAVQNRFESTINNLASSTSNLSEAQSRIQDADYATEVSNMSKQQILQKAGTSVLAQANQVPQNVLSLLQ